MPSYAHDNEKKTALERSTGIEQADVSDLIIRKILRTNK